VVTVYRGLLLRKTRRYYIIAVKFENRADVCDEYSFTVSVIAVNGWFLRVQQLANFPEEGTEHAST